jgi:uncharacterized protein YegP (UPF0339 family)
MPRSMPCSMPRFGRAIVFAVFGWSLVGGAAMALRSVAAPAPAAPAAPVAADEKPLAKFEVYKDRGGEFRWRLRSLNRQILATSGESYKAHRDCLSAIDSVKRAAANAPVEEIPVTPGQ